VSKRSRRLSAVVLEGGVEKSVIVIEDGGARVENGLLMSSAKIVCW